MKPLGKTVSFDYAADFYDETRGVPTERLATALRAAMEMAGFRPGEWALEPGVGTARVATVLASLGANVLGVDISTRMLARGAAKRENDGLHTLHLVLGDIRRRCWRERSFKLVCFVHVLHLIEDWRDALAAAMDGIQPGGYILLLNAGGMRLVADIEARYHELAEALGHKRQRLGAPDRSAIVAECVGRGYAVRELPKVEWEVQATPFQALERLEGRVASACWDCEDGIHSAVMTEVRQWTAAAYPNLDAPIRTMHDIEGELVGPL